MNDTVQQTSQTILDRCPSSYAAMFRDRVFADPDGVAYTIPKGKGWQDITWSQVRGIVDQAATGLIALGLEPEQRVAISCSTRVEWIEADLGISCAGGATTTIYPNTSVGEMAHIIKDSGSVMIVVENNSQLVQLHEAPELDLQLTYIILIDDDRPESQRDDDRVMLWTDLLSKGAAHLQAHPRCVDERIAALTPHSLSTLIYTSGTTGDPKGVELEHLSWTYEAAAMEYCEFVNSDDVLYLWLPLSHVFGRDLCAVQFKIGFRSVVDGRVNHIVEGLSVTKPTILVGVPRIFEKVRSAVMTLYPQNGAKGRVARWAFKVGKESIPYRISGDPLPHSLKARYALADKLVFSKLQKKLGGRMRYMISGSAKLSRQVQEWFYAAGITIVEGYGATESAAIAFFNLPGNPRFGSVGPAIPGVQAKIADDGEVLISGPTIARGYHNLPEYTAEAFRDGWYRTGDVGVLDAEGYLTITDRKKDIYKTSNGKFVAPQKVENAMMANIPYISQAVAICQDRKFVSALITLDEVQLRKWAERRGKGNLSYEELTKEPGIRSSMDRFIRKTNTRLERWEQIKRYTILPKDLSMSDGTLTPSLKIRRHEIYETYRETIDAMYSEDKPKSELVD